MFFSAEAHLALVVSPNDEDHWDLIHILRRAGWVLAQPFCSSEVLRCVESASRHWDEQCGKASESAEPAARYLRA